MASSKTPYADLDKQNSGGGGEGGVSDHGQLTGLADDDHPQYLTQSRGDIRYATPSSVSSAVTTHANAADPHPQYLTSTEGNAAYAPAGHSHTALDSLVGDVDGSHAANGAFANPIFNQYEQAMLVDSSTIEYIADILRAQGASGIVNTRQYEAGGTESYHRPSDTSYAALNLHNHPNYIGLPGMAEVSMVMNGYYLRSRHNDYSLVQRGDVGTNWNVTKGVTLPTVPGSVTAQGTLAAQITEMQQYFKAFADKNPTLRDYRPHFT